MNKPAIELGWIHFVLSLLAPILVIVLTGCEKKKELSLDYGPETPPEAVESALAKPLESIDPSAMKVGEFVHYAETQTIENRTEAMQVVSDTGQTVVEREELSDRILYTIVQNKVSYSGNESRKVSTELEMAVRKHSTSSAQRGFEAVGSPRSIEERVAAILDPTLPPLKTLDLVFSKESQPRITYHNLQVSEGKTPAPDLVASQPGCLGIPDCQIPVHVIAFDQIAWLSETETEKVSFEFTISGGVPYLAALMNKCATLLVPIDGIKPKESTKVLVRQCSPVLNFRWQEATAANRQSAPVH